MSGRCTGVSPSVGERRVASLYLIQPVSNPGMAFPGVPCASRASSKRSRACETPRRQCTRCSYSLSSNRSGTAMRSQAVDPPSRSDAFRSRRPVDVVRNGHPPVTVAGAPCSAARVGANPGCAGAGDGLRKSRRRLLRPRVPKVPTQGNAAGGARVGPEPLHYGCARNHRDADEAVESRSCGGTIALPEDFMPVGIPRMRNCRTRIAPPVFPFR